jgi:hypothetical protein
VFAISLLSACAQNPSADGVDASAARADEQINAGQPSEEPTLVEDPKPMPEPTTDLSAEADASSQAIRDVVMGANPPKYRVNNDGTLIIGGDVVVRCADLLKYDFRAASAAPKVRRQIAQARKEQVRACTKAGFPPDAPTDTTSGLQGRASSPRPLDRARHTTRTRTRQAV